MRASFREYSWARALVSLCLMVVGAMVLPACPPAAPSDVCIAGNASGTVCASGDVCNAMAIATGGSHTCAIVGPQLRCRAGSTLTSPVNGACAAGASPITVGTEIRCWGKNEDGQLGNGPHSDDNPQTKRNSPTRVSNPASPTSGTTQVREYLRIATGENHTCALLVGGAVECWGENDSGQLGNVTSGYSEIPVPVVGLTNVVEIAAGSHHTCAIVEVPGADMGAASRREVRCWGNNIVGQLGSGRSGAIQFGSTMPVAVRASAMGTDNLSNVVEISAGGNHTCARLQNGEVRCWGYNIRGQLGNGSVGSDTVRSRPVAVRASAMGTDNLSNVVELAAGESHTCARLQNGEVRCWGGNESGQLGNVTVENEGIPVSVVGLSNVVELAAGANHTCARLHGGEVRCWGDNESGPLGNGIAGEVRGVFMPVTVTGLTNVVELAAGLHHTCARLNTGEVRCWGKNEDGQLGDRTFTTSRAPPTSGTLCCPENRENPTDPAHREACASGCVNLQTDNANCGACDNACAAGEQCTAGHCLPATACSTCVYSACSTAANDCARDATCRTWLNCHAACADDTCRDRCMNASMRLATEVTRCQATQCESACRGHRLAAGESHTCAIDSDENVVCWGGNNTEQLGVSGSGGRCIAVPGPTKVVEVAAGSGFSCARTSDERVSCWGRRSMTDPSVTALSDVVQVAAGASHACALLSGGKVRCWGSNGVGQLGDGGTTASVTPVEVTGLTGVVEIAAGENHTCARRSDGTVRCWGDASGRGGSSPTMDVQGLSGVVGIAAGSGHTCARIQNGDVRCWGSNSSGQLGNGTTTNSSTPVAVTGLTNVVEIAAGNVHTCARLQGGAVRCWGNNEQGQLGDGTKMERSTPVAVAGLTDAVEIDAGTTRTCARLSNGDVRCWGDNTSGALGVPTSTTSSSTPVLSVCVRGCAVNGTAPATTACDFACVDTQTNAAHCGTCGNACTDGRTCVAGACVVPLRCDAPLVACGTGEAAGCFNLQSSVCHCGSCGNVCTAGQACIAGTCQTERATGIAAGWHHTCEVTTSGAVRCWGENAYGRRGDGTPTSCGVCSGPATIPGSPPIAAVQVVAGLTHTCARLENGEVRCWGLDDLQQLGNGSEGDSPTPVAVRASASGTDNLTNVVELAAGDFHTCARLQNSEVRCWGYNHRGQLGDGSERAGPTPVAVRASAMGTDNLTNVVELAAGNSHTCARRTDGSVWCWGSNDRGQLGINTVPGSATPFRVPGFTDVVEIAAGSGHTCARGRTGRVLCWGANASGQLGDASTMPSSTPVVVVEDAENNGEFHTFLGNVVAIAAGSSHTCALLQSSEVRCWGSNAQGQLGGGPEVMMFARVSAPASPEDRMPILRDVVEIAAGSDHTCARLMDGSVRCWGANEFGQLGVGQGGDSLFPVTATCTGATTCSAGQTACGTGCCPMGQTCQNGTTCVTPMSSCMTGQTSCPVVGCVDLMRDRNHCGACGNPCGSNIECVMGTCTPTSTACMFDTECPSGQTCQSNVCVPVAPSCTPACSTGQTCCDGVCRDLQTDTAACGTCGTPCMAGQSCMAGVCTPATTCVAPMPTMCGTTCVDTSTSPANCGRCGNACTAPMNGAATCAAGVCGFTCNMGLSACAGACVDTQSNSTHCGMCGRACPMGQSCSRGVCTLPCAPGTTNCDGTCANTQTDVNNCGACGTRCPSGQSCCSGVCAATNTTTHCGMCGVTCAAPTSGTAACTSGACAIGSCNMGFADCDANPANGCETTLGTTSNCASCGIACTAPMNGMATCISGMCGFTCIAGSTRCGTACVNTQTDNANCGRCGSPCPTGQVCSSGVCAVSCATDRTNCSGACVDLTNDLAHCGMCGRACAPLTGGMAACVASTCRSFCPGGTHAVGTACVGDGGPKPVSPISLGDVTQLRPAFRWINPTNANGAVIEVCNDRACTSIAQTIMAPASGTVAATTVTATAALTAAHTYYWRVRAMVGAVADTTNNSPVWLFHTPRANRGMVQTSVRPHLDVNGDGFDDLAVGVPNASSGAGRVDLFLGSALGLSMTVHRSLAGSAGARFGTSVSSAGDVNGDGFGDLVVGAPGAASGNGTVSLYLGSASGLSATASFTATGAAGAALGTSVTGAGDVDLDGYADLVAGAPAAGSGAGSVIWYRGAATVASLTAATLTGSGGSNVQFGLTLAGVGDLNGDGYSDVLVGEPGYNSNQGRLHVFRGGATGLPMSATTRLDGGSVGDRFTVGLAGAGDVNADGYSDAVASAPLALGGNVGGFNVFVGGAGGLTTASVPAGNVSNAGWGRILAGAGDVNGNGRDDVLVAAPFVDSNRGRVYLVDGDALIAAGTFGFPTRLFEMSGDAQYASLGASLAGLGDTNGDGFADVAFGAPGENSDSLGKVYVLRGAMSVPATASAFMISMAGGDRYGAAIGGLDSIVPDAPATCSMGLARCGAACVDTSSNASNCGGCGRACATGQTCMAGVCTTGTTCTPGTVCRTAMGTCDVAEMCTAAGACPSDAFLPSSTVCRAAAGTCDVAETCTGSSAACPSDAFLPSSTVCRAAVTASCDPAESCTGASAACPSDVSSSCTSGQSCVSGVCMTAGCTGARPMTCGGSSVDLNESRTNCGACGNDCGSCGAACAQARACLAGVCTSFGTGVAASDMPTMSAGVEMGDGAEPFDDRCPQGYALTRTNGFVGPSGITGLQATCSRILLNYTTCGGATIAVGTTTLNLAIHGGAGPFGIPGVCPPGEVMAGFSGSASGQINAFTMRCGGLSATLTPPPLDVTVGSLSDDFTQGDASSGVPFGPFDCPPGTIAVGITGWETPSAVQGIALRCARPVANTMTPP